MNNHMGGTYMSHLVFKGEDDSFKKPEVVAYMDAVQRHIEKNDAVGATTSVVDILKKIAFELLRSEYLPENYDEIAQYYFIYEMAGGDPTISSRSLPRILESPYMGSDDKGRQRKNS